jgi:hypothetical protein
MNKEDKFVIEDCVKFKQDLAEKSWKRSGAKTLEEYVKYVNERAKQSPLWKNANENRKE